MPLATLQLLLCRLANQAQESLVYVSGQVTGLHGSALLLVRESRALPGNGTASVRHQRQRLGPAEVVVVVPDAVVVCLPPGQERSKRTGQSVSLATSTLESTLDLGGEGVLAVGDVVNPTLLDDGGATVGLGELLAQCGWVFCRWVDVLGLGQASELDNVWRQDTVFVTLDKFGTCLGQPQTVGVEDKGNALLSCFGDDTRASLQHGFITTETGTDDNDVETAQHGGDSGGNAVDGVRLVDVL